MPADGNFSPERDLPRRARRPRLCHGTQAAPASARVDYPSNRLANVRDLKVDEPFDVSYPDSDAPGVLSSSASACRAASGPDGDIVGFSTICPHKGFPLAYNRPTRR